VILGTAVEKKEEREVGMAEERMKGGLGARIETADVNELKRQLDQTRNKNKQLKIATIGLLVMAAITCYWLWNYFVLSYATIDNVAITQKGSDPGAVIFTFTVTKSGFLKYGYAGAVLEERVTAGDKKQFSWKWSVPPAAREFAAFVRCRWMIFPSWHTKTFPIVTAR